jgi:hypothetical protein
MKYVPDMGPGAMIYMSSFIKIGSGTQVNKERYTDTQAAWRPHKSSLIFTK